MLSEQGRSMLRLYEEEWQGSYLAAGVDGAMSGTLLLRMVSLRAGTSFARTVRHLASCASSR